MKKECQPAWGPCPGACRYFGADPDGDYCGHPKSLEVSAGFGRSTSSMSLAGLCTHGAKGEYQLWEGRKVEANPVNDLIGGIERSLASRAEADKSPK